MEKRQTVPVGAVVQMRKAHACGANAWTVLSTGIDIRVRCTRCGRAVLMPREQFERAVRKVLPPDASEPGEATDA